MATQISRLNWARIATLLTDLMPMLHVDKDKFAHTADIKMIAQDSSVLPQLMFLIGERYTPVKNPTNGLYSFAATAASLPEQTVTWDGTTNTSRLTLSELRGILMFMKIIPRGVIMPYRMTQSGDGRKFCAMVPLILASWKLHKGIQYSEWDWSEDYTMRRRLLDDDMAEYSEYFSIRTIPDWSQEELQMFHDTACTVGKTGQRKSPETVTQVTRIYDGLFKPLPALLKHSLLQTWVASPHLYLSTMITNPYSLDIPTESRFGNSAEIFEETAPVKLKNAAVKEPVDLF